MKTYNDEKSIATQTKRCDFCNKIAKRPFVAVKNQKGDVYFVSTVKFGHLEMKEDEKFVYVGYDCVTNHKVDYINPLTGEKY